MKFQTDDRKLFFWMQVSFLCFWGMLSVLYFCILIFFIACCWFQEPKADNDAQLCSQVNLYLNQPLGTEFFIFVYFYCKFHAGRKLFRNLLDTYHDENQYFGTCPASFSVSCTVCVLLNDSSVMTSVSILCNTFLLFWLRQFLTICVL